MFIIHVTPITKGGIHQLSYFSSQEFPIGTIVYVPLRNKEIPALVLEREDARAIKSILRTNVYETRKVKRQEPLQVFSYEFIKAAQLTAKYFAVSVGSIIHSYTPSAILSSATDNKLEKPSEQKNKKNKFERNILQIPLKARIEKYKTVIRSNFAKGNSIFLCVSTLKEVPFFGEQCSRGIEKYTFMLESSQTKKKQQEVWNAALREKHPVLIVATPIFVSIPRRDISMFILENEMSSSYKQQFKPNVNARILIENLASETNSSIVYAGTTIDVRIHRFLRSGFATELGDQSRKLRTSSLVKIIDSKKERVLAKEQKKDFPILSQESITVLKEAQEVGKLSFVFANRRGIASQTICNDCGETIKCAHCKSPMVLHERRGARELLCHRCGSMRDANETCINCGSWNLVPLGIGVTRIEQFIKKNIPNAIIFIITSDTIKTPIQAKKVIEKFYNTKGAILIGTEMAIPYLTEEVEYSVISSIDSLLCIPDFHIEEKIFGIIAMLREKTLKTLLIETTSPKNTMLRYAKNGSLAEYAEKELELRKKLQYPPYTHILKITCCGTKEKTIQNMQKFVELTQVKYKPRVFSGFIQKGHDLELHALIKIPVKQWPDKELSAILENLPMSFTVNVNPERTL